MIINNLMHRAGKYLINIFLFIFSLSCIYPFIWLLYSSLKKLSEFNNNIISLPTELYFNNYIQAWQRSSFDIYSINSLFNSVISTFFVILIAYTSGYFLSRYKFWGSKIIYILYMFGMLIPIHSLLVPVFIQFRTLDLLNNRLTLIFPYVAFGLPFSVFLITSFIKKVPREMEEAAYIEGCAITRIMFSIILPMCRPILVTIAILNFMNNWNEFPFALILISRDTLKTIALGLHNFAGQYTVDYTQQMAAMVLATIPVMLVYFFFSQQISQGMAAGAVKG
jgi:raffinose/stachyose/melibiose transport system permease protein